MGKDLEKIDTILPKFNIDSISKENESYGRLYGFINGINRDLKHTTAETVTGASLNKRSNDQRNCFTRALQTFFSSGKGQRKRQNLEHFEECGPGRLKLRTFLGIETALSFGKKQR